MGPLEGPRTWNVLRAKEKSNDDDAKSNGKDVIVESRECRAHNIISIGGQLLLIVINFRCG